MSVHTQSMGEWGPRCDQCEQSWPCRTLLVRELAANQERVRALVEGLAPPWAAGGFLCLGCGEWAETRATIKHEACWLPLEARAALAADAAEDV